MILKIKKIENILNSSSKFFEDFKNEQIKYSVLNLVSVLKYQNFDVKIPSFLVKRNK